jgi:hypothetical protein
MAPMDPKGPNDPADPRPGRGKAGLRDRDDLLAAHARRVIDDLDACAVVIYLPQSGRHSLKAAAVAVRPLGLGALETVALDDDVFASARAYSSGEVETAYSSDEVGSHPEFAVFAPFPFTVHSTAITTGPGPLGVLAVYWPALRHRLTGGQRTYLTVVAGSLAQALGGLASRGAPMTADGAPRAVPAPWRGPADDTQQEAEASAPLLYHLQKLTVSLNQTPHTKEAVRLVIQRVTSGLDVQAVVITMLEGGRLHVVGSSGARGEFLRALNGRQVRDSSPETDALASSEFVLLDSPAAL